MGRRFQVSVREGLIKQPERSHVDIATSNIDVRGEGLLRWPFCFWLWPGCSYGRAAGRDVRVPTPTCTNDVARGSDGVRGATTVVESALLRTWSTWSGTPASGWETSGAVPHNVQSMDSKTDTQTERDRRQTETGKETGRNVHRRTERYRDGQRIRPTLRPTRTGTTQTVSHPPLARAALRMFTLLSQSLSLSLTRLTEATDTAD